KTKNKRLSTSRLTAVLASFAPDHPAHLEDFLTRRGHWTLATLMDQLGFNIEQTKIIGDPTATLETLSPRELAQNLLASSLASILFEYSHKRRQRLLKHLKQIGALENNYLYLMDLGYAATIQRAIQRIFTIEKIPIITHGLYMVSAHVSLATQMAGGIVEGFLAQNGNPNDFARAFCRSPEVVELSCMPPYGTVTNYTENGDPIYADDITPLPQQHEIGIIQQAIRDFADRFLDLVSKNIIRPDFMSKNWQNQMRAIATRLVVYPSPIEAKLLGHWQADSDLGLTSPRPILSTGPYSKEIFSMCAEQLATLPRRDIPWLYGVAVNVDYKLGKQVANLMLRKEKFTSSK
ncbi:MAG: hypothetical protein WAO98_10920, partial [Alphaproteobacteria bacterium]